MYLLFFSAGASNAWTPSSFSSQL